MTAPVVRRGLCAGALAVCVALLFSTPAVARSGSYWPFTAGPYDAAAVTGNADDYSGAIPGGATYLYSDSGAGLMDPGDGSPHGGYVDTSAKCRFCHAVHGAGYNPDQRDTLLPTQRLLRGTTAASCVFCHITSNFSNQIVYGAVEANYRRIGAGERLAGMSGHVDRHNATSYEGCASCHSVHGSNTILNSPILKDDPARGVTSHLAVTYGGGTGWGAFILPVTNQRDFCLDCHDGVNRYLGTQATPMDNQPEFDTVFPECADGCHTSVSLDYAAGTYIDPVYGDEVNIPGDPATAAANARDTQFGIDASAARNGRSHVMTTALFGDDGTTKLAWNVTAVASEGPLGVSNSCTTCHDTVGTGFPHITPTQDLIGDHTSVTHLDKVCAKCHTDTGLFATQSRGVGIDY